MNSKMIFATLITIALMTSTGCTTHYAHNITQTDLKQTKSTEITSAQNITNRLYGTWKLDKLDMPSLSENAASFGSQADKDAQSAKLSKYQDALKGLTVTFKNDSTYVSTYNGLSDVGTWKVNAPNDIAATSKVSGVQSLFQNATISGNTLTVKYTPGDMSLQMTLIKQ